jgi:hypothetical protein
MTCSGWNISRMVVFHSPARSPPTKMGFSQTRQRLCLRATLTVSTLAHPFFVVSWPQDIDEVLSAMGFNLEFNNLHVQINVVRFNLFCFLQVICEPSSQENTVTILFMDTQSVFVFLDHRLSLCQGNGSLQISHPFNSYKFTQYSNDSLADE